jgi:DNA-binding CsgD family transcriptional regulator/sugar-specific transcriptional regulator TrmB
MTNGETAAAVVIGKPVPSLVRWGRSPDADLVYRALVTLGPAAERDLRRGLGITPKRVGRAIDELVSIGAVHPRPSRKESDTTWSARPPAEVVSTLYRDRFRSESRRTRSPQRRPAAAADVVPEPLTLGDGLRHLVTRSLTRERLVELNAVAHRELLAMNPEMAFEPESVRAAAPLDRRLLDRGVPMRVLGVRPPEIPLPTRAGAAAGPKPQHRLALAVPMKLIVFDRAVALFPVDPHNFERGYLEVTQPPVVSALVAMYERTWAEARDVQEDTMPEVVLSPREQALIGLLAQGHTDITAARELGLSPRSVSTILRHLMDSFQVDNRFQLGLALGALRAVPLPPPGDPARRKAGHES